MKENELKQRLNYIILNEPNSIKAFVAKEALKRKDINKFFGTVTKKGCVSGMITTLNFQEQTHHFFNSYYDEIEELRLNFEEQSGGPIDMPFGIKNTFTWFAFEQTAKHLIQELDITTPNF